MDEVSQQVEKLPNDTGKSTAGKGHARVWRRVLIVVLVIAVALGGVALWSLISSTNAVNNYIEAVDKQYKEIVAGDNIDQPDVKLNEVVFGEVVNGKYRRAKELESTYAGLIEQLRNYTQTMAVHNQLVEKFNTGINGNASLDGDILELVNQLDSLVSNKYPDQTEAVTEIHELSQLIAASTSFDEISSQMNKVLYDNDKWLATERENIEAARTEFQQAINSL